MPADTSSEASKAIKAFRARVDSVGGNAGGGGGFGGPGGGRRPPPNFFALNGRLVGELGAQDNADQAPTEAMLAGYATACRDLKAAAATWATLTAKELVVLNALLTKNGAQPVTAAPPVTAPGCEEKAVR
jgi:hypothetical protein